MSNTAPLPKPVEPAPEDGEPPSPGTMRSWGPDWKIDPFKHDTDYVTGLEHLELLRGRSDEDLKRDQEVLAVTAIRRVRLREEFFNPTIEPKPKTAPQRLGEALRKTLRGQSSKVA